MQLGYFCLTLLSFVFPSFAPIAAGGDRLCVRGWLKRIANVLSID